MGITLRKGTKSTRRRVHVYRLTIEKVRQILVYLRLSYGSNLASSACKRGSVRPSMMQVSSRLLRPFFADRLK
jgi:hypothetical protein